MKVKIAILLNLLLVPMVLACGYHLMGKGGEFPGGVTTLAISSLENKTPEPNLDTIFVSAFRREFISRRELEIVSSDKAQASLQGAIRSFTTHSLAYDEEGRVKEHRITIILDLLLMHQGNGEILWRGEGIKRSEEYKASSDVMVNEGRKNRAIRKIAADLAEEVYFRIKEEF